jgi:hypothetical protein
MYPSARVPLTVSVFVEPGGGPPTNQNPTGPAGSVSLDMGHQQVVDSGDGYLEFDSVAAIDDFNRSPSLSVCGNGPATGINAEQLGVETHGLVGQGVSGSKRTKRENKKQITHD